MTTSEVAEEVGLSWRRVQQYAKRAGVPKRGRDYDFSEDHVKEILASKDHKRIFNAEAKADRDRLLNEYAYPSE